MSATDLHALLVENALLPILRALSETSDAIVAQLALHAAAAWAAPAGRAEQIAMFAHEKSAWHVFTAASSLDVFTSLLVAPPCARTDARVYLRAAAAVAVAPTGDEAAAAALTSDEGDGERRGSSVMVRPFLAALAPPACHEGDDHGNGGDDGDETGHDSSAHNDEDTLQSRRSGTWSDESILASESSEHLQSSSIFAVHKTLSLVEYPHFCLRQ
jgi:hypothetical protein